MKAAIKSHAKRSTTLSLIQAKRLLVLGTNLADLAEDILEERGEYSPEFRASLARANADVKAGRVVTVGSLDELLK